MEKFISLVIAVSIGATLGTIFHPNLLEIALIALVFIGVVHAIHSRKGKSPFACI